MGSSIYSSNYYSKIPLIIVKQLYLRKENSYNYLICMDATK